VFCFLFFFLSSNFSLVFVLLCTLLHYILKKKAASRCFSTAEKEYLVVSSLGNDRRGIVSDVSQIITENHHGSIGESRAVKLGSHFGLMMVVSVPKNESEALQSALTSAPGLATTCCVTDNPTAVPASPNITYSAKFTLNGADRQSIVHKVTSLISEHDLQILKMQTYENQAPFGGVTLFHMEGIATSTAPYAVDFDVEGIQKELNKLGDSLNCDITFETRFDNREEVCKEDEVV